jgi:hypothetical protein
MPYTMNAEIYPTEYRGLCVAQSTGVFWATNFVVSLTFLTLARVMGNAGVFFLYAGIVFVSEIYFYFVVPETSGLSLHEIQAIFEQKPGESIALSDSSTKSDGIETTEYGATATVESSPEEVKLPSFV